MANVLAHYQHLDIHTFEAAPVVSERGAAVALAIHTQEALRYIPAVGGQEVASDILSRAQAVPIRFLRLLMVRKIIVKSHVNCNANSIIPRAEDLKQER